LGRPRITLDRQAEIRKRLEAGAGNTSISTAMLCEIGAATRIKREEETKS